MKIDVSSIVKVEGSYIEFELEENIDLFNEKLDDFQFEPKVKFSGIVTNVGSILRLSGVGEVSYSVDCNMCLENFTKTLKFKLKDVYYQKEVEEDSDSYVFTGHKIDIDRAVFDTLVLNLPMKPVCKDECKGLCPICGKNRNEVSCECDNSVGDERLSILKNFFNK